MKTLLLAGILALSFGGPVWACLNISDVTMDGRKSEVDNVAHTSRERLLQHEKRETWQARAKKLSKAMAGRPTITDRSDYGAVLAHLGQYEKAREVLEEAEKVQPGHYTVASNLGTVYELLGRNQDARKWIEKGITLNPKSHEGSEWLHLRILDVKMELERDPKWLETHTVLGKEVDYGSAPRPRPAAAGDNGQRIQTLAYQLHERLQFVKAPEPVVGELLFDLANEVAVRGAVKIALGIYELSATYQPARAELLRQRTEYMRTVLAKAGPLAEERTFRGR